MTRGDFILGVISSLIATILFELTRRFYTRIQISSVIKLVKSLFRVFTVPKLSARVLSYSIMFVLTISGGMNIFVRTVFAPTGVEVEGRVEETENGIKVTISAHNAKAINQMLSGKRIIIMSAYKINVSPH